MILYLCIYSYPYLNIQHHFLVYYYSWIITPEEFKPAKTPIIFFYENYRTIIGVYTGDLLRLPI